VGFSQARSATTTAPATATTNRTNAAIGILQRHVARTNGRIAGAWKPANC
jgi:hypothetical protein